LPVVSFISSLNSLDYSAISMKYNHSLVTNISKNLINFETLSVGENRRQKKFKILFSKIVYPKIGAGYALLFAFLDFFQSFP
jgi:hypothetical protein